MPKAPKAKVGQDKKPIHPNSRKAQQLTRKASRDLRLGERNLNTQRTELLADRLMWFQKNANLEKKCLKKCELASLGKKYLTRFEDELDQIDIMQKIGNRQGRQHASREAAISLTMEKEKEEFASNGLELPDVINAKNFDYFKQWNGEIKYLQNIKLKKIASKDLEEECDEVSESQDTQMEFHDSDDSDL
ncbi:translation machinery-associated protein 16-like isoform X2 [Mizuhopecten yessoensis]|uniref:Translation machinery-associated protein 16 n=2 Tax=Mizuhopecten yessoensis TaxID=6573 RepID=A0A210QV75_MIZYE|nr:translation machinery-associated protein 16-like isoform X2 [Mizuhopecten yessoensis]OWF52627.1 Translation machinery-associated protein 16 [Mizuhopecten yessoensis]